MSTSAPTPRAPQGDRRRTALGAMMALAAASATAMMSTGPAWMHWTASLVAVAAALGVVVIAELTWQGAVNNAAAEGLVARSAGGYATEEAATGTPGV